MMETQAAQDYINNSNNNNSLQIRIVTDPLIDKIEEYLTGTQIFYQTDKQGNMTRKFIKKGEPLCNEQGVQHLLNFCQLQINQWTVQGNTDKFRLGRWLKDNMQLLTQMLTVNRQPWGVDTKSRWGILNCLMNSLEMFATRTLDNKEREGYIPTLRMVENNTINDNSQKQGLSLFGKKLTG